MPDMGDLSGTVEGTGPDGPSADPGSSIGSGSGENGGGGGLTSSQAGVALETVSAIGTFAIGAITMANPTTAPAMAIAVGTMAMMGAAGFVIEKNGDAIMGNLSAVGSPTLTQVGTAAILMAQGVTLNPTQSEATSVFDGIGGNETVALADLLTAANVFYPGNGAETNNNLNQFLYAMPMIDQLVQNTVPGNAVLMTAAGAMGVTNSSVAEIDTDYGQDFGGKLNVLLPDNNIATFSPDLNVMSVMRVSDWLGSYYNELKPDGMPTTVAALMADREMQNPTLGAPNPGGSGGSG